MGVLLQEAPPPEKTERGPFARDLIAEIGYQDNRGDD